MSKKGYIIDEYALNKEETENVSNKLERCNKALGEFGEQMKRVAELARKLAVAENFVEEVEKAEHKINKAIKKGKKGKKLKNWEKTKFYQK